MLRDPVVPDHRSREADDLPREARIGDDLLVAGHPRREHGLTERDAVRADALTGEDLAVLENQEARSCLVRDPAGGDRQDDLAL